MGIDIEAGRVVRYNPEHQQRVITDVARQPSRRRLGALQVVSVFGRRKVNKDKLDGNPLIYALKGKFGYSMPYADFRAILRCAQTILPNALAGTAFDVVVPLPSSSLVAAIFAKRAARHVQGSPIIPCLDKATVGQVLARAPAPSNVERRFQADYKSELHTLQGLNPAHIFQMKEVAFPLRRYFTPVIANRFAMNIVGARILLVDDILGSGTSLTAAADALRPYGPHSIAGLTLMGQLG